MANAGTNNASIAPNTKCIMTSEIAGKDYIHVPLSALRLFGDHNYDENVQCYIRYDHGTDDNRFEIVENRLIHIDAEQFFVLVTIACYQIICSNM